MKGKEVSQPQGQWRHAIARGLYDGALTGLLPLALPLSAWHPHTRSSMRERMGRLSPGLSVQRPVWCHGASAGDVTALRAVMTFARAHRIPAVLSSWTRAGLQVAARWPEGSGAALFGAPLDLRRVTTAALRRVDPRLLVLECLELWPNLVLSCRDRGVPVVVINGRLSARSLGRYRRFDALFGPCFRCLRLVVALDQENANRFVAAGVPADRVAVCPSTKHVARVTTERVAAEIPPKVVLGSLHWAEAKRIVPAVVGLLHAHPQLRVVVVPRYPGEAARMRRLLRRLGAVPRRDGDVGWATRVRVANQMGTLAAQYAGAVAAFVGGSLNTHGGHNVMEAAARGVPVVVGPHHHNCLQEVRRLSQHGGGFVAHDGAQIVAMLHRLLSDAALARRSAVKAATVADEFARDARQIESLLLPLMGVPEGVFERVRNA